jgi:hypothetical protein
MIVTVISPFAVLITVVQQNRASDRIVRMMLIDRQIIGPMRYDVRRPGRHRERHRDSKQGHEAAEDGSCHNDRWLASNGTGGKPRDETKVNPI